jgi:ribosomal RNA-processing protein 12
MVNFRHRTKGKGKRWKKGHSSSSNPEIKRHRNVAKSKFFQEHSGKCIIKFMRDTLHVVENCSP